MRMMLRFKRLVVAVLCVAFLVVSGVTPNIASISSMAAEAGNAYELANVFPAGTTLYSDTFPGLHVTYDARESHVIREGKNEVSLGVSVTDKKLAAVSTVALKTIFGTVRVPTDEGETFYTKAFVIGISTGEYEDIVLKTGNVSLYNLVKSLSSKDAKEAVNAYASFLIKLSEAVQFMKNEESKPAESNQQTSDEGELNEGQGGDRHDEEDKEETYDRTFLIYMCGADLESKYGCGSQNLIDLIKTQMPESVKVYVVTGGAKKWHMNDPDVYREYVRGLLYPDKTYDELPKEAKARIDNMAVDLLSKYEMNISADEIKIWEVVNEGGLNSLEEIESFAGRYMTEPEFLSQMIDYVAPEDPYEKFDLILWDHGGGYGGYGVDELLAAYKEEHKEETGLPDTGFSLKHLREALEVSEFIQCGRKFDFIGFDACQMANYEAVSTLKDLSYYYIGSEENEFGSGWNYNALFSELEKNPEIGTRELGEKVVDAFIKKFEDDLKSCQSLIDMTQVGELDDALSNFAEILLEEIEQRDFAYYDVLDIVGKKSHFATRNGWETSNYLDIKRFVTPFASKEVFSKELKDAANNVLENLDDCVLYNKWVEREVQNGGLSIYFPLAAYYMTDADNEGRVWINQTASDAVKIYETTGLNNEYKKAIARFALMNLAGKFLGDDWVDETIVSTDQLIAIMKKNHDTWEENWKHLYEAAAVNENDPDDPTLKSFDKLLEDRITKGDIIVALPEKVGDEYKESNPATVEILEPDPVVLEDAVKVKPILFDSNSKYVGTIGETILYSETKENTGSEVTYNVWPYNCVWYLINDQICSMYVTKIDEDGSYQGNIPVCYWKDAKSASTLDMNEGESRSDYLKRAAKEEKVTTVYLNVFSDEKRENLNVASFNYVYESDGSVGDTQTKLEDLEGWYFELLGGADNFYKTAATPGLFSLGTIYNEQGKGFTIKTAYVDTGSYYYVNDIYGNKYELSNSNLGAGKGLDDFYSMHYADEEGNPIHYMTWEESLQKADEIRAMAEENANYAQNQEDSNRDQNQMPAAALRSMAVNDQAVEELETKTAEKAAEETVEKAVEEAEVKASEETAKEAAEETVEKAVEETKEEAVEETVEKAAEETPESAVEQMPEALFSETITEAKETIVDDADASKQEADTDEPAQADKDI